MVDADTISYRHDAKYSELSWAINALGQILGIEQPIDVDLDRDRYQIYEQYIQLEKEDSLAVRFPDIAKQWHPTKNGKLNPEQVSFGSQKECGG